MSNAQQIEQLRTYIEAAKQAIKALEDDECDPVEGCTACDGCGEDEDENVVTVTKEARTTYSQNDIDIAVTGDVVGVSGVELSHAGGYIYFEGDDAHTFFSIMERVMQGMRRTA